MDPTTLPAAVDPVALSSLGSIAGVISLTLFLMATVVKPLAARCPVLQKLPTWSYTVAVALGLTAFARYGLGTLEGDIGALLYQAAVAALAAMGVRAAALNLGTSVQESAGVPSQVDDDQPVGNWPPIVGLLFGAVVLMNAGGCATVDLPTEVHRARVLHTIANEELNAFYDDRLITKRELIEIGEVLDQAEPILAAAEAVADRVKAVQEAGGTIDPSDPETVRAFLQDVRAVLRAAASLRDTARSKKVPHADPLGERPADRDVDRGTDGGGAATQPSGDGSGETGGAASTGGGEVWPCRAD